MALGWCCGGILLNEGISHCWSLELFGHLISRFMDDKMMQ